MTAPAHEISRRVSISVPNPSSSDGNRNNGLLQTRMLTPYIRLPNSYVQIGRTPHNSFALECDQVPATPRQIGNHPLQQSGAGLIRASLVAQRLKSFRLREDQENDSGDEGPEITSAYQLKVNTPTSIRQITRKLADEKFEQGVWEG